MTQLYVVYKKLTPDITPQTDRKQTNGKDISLKHQKKAEVAILISHKVDLKLPEKEMMKRLIYRDDIKILNMYAPKDGATKHVN